MNDKLQKHVSTYELFARYLSAIVTSVPFLLIGFVLLRRDDTKDMMSFVISLKFFGYVSMSFIGLYFYAQLIRSTAKSFEKQYFHKRRGFPTTYFMLYSDSECSDVYKDDFRKRVKKTFGFQLCSKSEELSRPEEAMRRLNDITKQLILHVGDGILVGKHNQWYGFIRNLVGGSLYGVIGSIVSFPLGRYILNDSILAYSAIPLLAIYGAILLFRRSLIVQHAEAYARQLHAEFMKK
jgi:hypothetical protein